MQASASAPSRKRLSADLPAFPALPSADVVRLEAEVASIKQVADALQAEHRDLMVPLNENIRRQQANHRGYCRALDAVSAAREAALFAKN